MTFSQEHGISSRPMTAVNGTGDTGLPVRVVRIAHASLTPALRGRERAIVRRFPNVDMVVVTPTHWRETGVDVDAVDDEHFPVIKTRTFLSKHIQLFAYDPLPIIRAFRNHHPDIIDMDHEPYSIPCAEIVQLRNLFAPNARIVMQTAQNIVKSYPPPFSMLERRALKQVSAAYMCSETVREVLEAKGFSKPVFNAPFGIDRELFYPDPDKRRNGDPPTIGFVGRLIRGKGILELLDALSIVRDLEWKLVIVGDGERREAAHTRIKDHGLEGRVKFTGAIPYEETAGYFRSFDLLVVPTRTTKKIREQFGRVIIEAMACGVPVIGSTCGAIPEVISDTGLIYEEGDKTALANQIRSLLENPEKMLGLGIAARDRAITEFTWERAAEEIYKAYMAAIEERK